MYEYRVLGGEGFEVGKDGVIYCFGLNPRDWECLDRCYHLCSRGLVEAARVITFGAAE